MLRIKDGAALGALVLFWILHIKDLGRLMCVILGVATLSCGLQAFRVRRFPEWAEEFIKVRPKYARAAATAMFGVLMIFVAVFLP